MMDSRWSYLLAATAVIAGLLVYQSSQAETAHGPGLIVRNDGALLKDGLPYRGVGVNCFDAFAREVRKHARTRMICTGNSIIGLGASTDIASAYLKEPRIAERVIVFWHFRTRWPEKCWNFNVIGDVRAARIVFHSDLSFVLFDTGTHLTCPMSESQQFASCGELGKYLHPYRYESSWYQDPKKGFYDLGDIAALVDPNPASWEVVKCPEVDWDLAYKFNGTKGSILRCYDIDRDRTFGLSRRKLQTLSE